MSKIARVNTKIFCDVCGLEIELTNYRLHCRTAHKKQEESKKKAKKEYICEVCLKSHTSKFNLNYHLAHHYNLKNFECDVCPNAYNTKSDLNQHKKSHENKTVALNCNNSIQCSICNRSFSSSWHLEEHLKKHLRKKGAY
jgi:Zinc finger, C2H2 type/C2H2-type zinc finger/Zinc-finger of C2H2 type